MKKNWHTYLSDYLRNSDYETHSILNGNGVLPWFTANRTDLILLDIMLPDTDGLTLCREIRKLSNVPIIMATARVDEIDRLLGLELGADDYICKPFSPREVVARVRAVLRRSNSDNISEDVEGIEIDENKYKVLINGKTLDLTAVEFQLFKTLYKRPGQIFSRDKLMDNIYNDARVVNNRTIDSHIKKLRKKILDVNADFDCIQSVYGIGYKFELLKK